jgi:hypothetical protein
MTIKKSVHPFAPGSKQGTSESSPGGFSPSVSARVAHQPEPSQHRLLKRSEVVDRLCLSDDAIQELIDTRQLTLLRICGQERIDSRDVEGLIEAYRRTAKRSAGPIRSADSIDHDANPASPKTDQPLASKAVSFHPSALLSSNESEKS